MRKIALTIALFLTFLAFPTPKAYAACERALESPMGGTVLCSRDGLVACTDNTAVHDIFTYCCDTYTECPAGSAPVGASQIYKVCDGVPEDKGREACINCMAPESGENAGTWTAIGCVRGIDTPSDFIKNILSIGTGIAGGIAFLLILFGGLQILTSSGNPEQLNAGRELVSAAITGLILIIFSIFLLGFIGGNIIGIPGFGF
jgi:hypothetical protein